MSDDHRIVKLVSDVSHLQSDVTEIKSDVKSLTGAVEVLKTEFYSFRTEVAKEFGSSAKESGSFRTEVAKEFGALRAEMATRFGIVDTRIESLKTALEQTKRWVLVSGLSAIASLLTMLAALAGLGRSLKLFQ